MFALLDDPTILSPISLHFPPMPAFGEHGAPSHLSDPVVMEGAGLLPPITLASKKEETTRSPSSSHPKRGRTRSRARSTPHCTRRDCPISSSVHPFDEIPWISAMDAPSDDDVADIADLSLLDVVGESSGPGPVRRRRTSLRSRTRSPAAGPRFCDTPPYQRPRCTSSSFLQKLKQSAPPSTPVRQRRSSPARFHHLMPVLPCNDRTPLCKTPDHI